jgi:hypothetical protein
MPRFWLRCARPSPTVACSLLSDGSILVNCPASRGSPQLEGQMDKSHEHSQEEALPAAQADEEAAPQTAAASALGGAAGEAGGAYRRAVAAWIVTYGLRGMDLPGLDLPPREGVPVAVDLEADRPVDDILVELITGGEVQVQAKRRAGLTTSDVDSPFRAAVEQWKTAVRTPDDKVVRLVLAVGEPTRDLLALRQALSRLRAERSGALSPSEANALARFRKLVTDLSDQERQRLEQLAAVLPLQVERAGLGEAATAAALLDGAVAIHGEGQRAWRALTEFAGEHAQARTGNTMSGWLDGLRHRDVPLVADREASIASRLEARRVAVDRYRQRLVQAGSGLDLRGLGAPFPPLPITPRIAAIRVQPGGGRHAAPTYEGGAHLVPALRRRGRVVLTGLPASGKSTALRQAAAFYADRESWPLPIHLRLMDFLQRSDVVAPFDAALELAVRDADPHDRPLVEEELRDRAQQGPLVLFLDGLDETRERRHETVQRVGQMLQHLHTDVEIVVATRDLAYAAASTLGFKDVRLLPPQSMDEVVAAVLSAMGGVQKIPEGDRTVWVEQRTRWIGTVVRRDQYLQETPLMAILLALLAGDRDRKDLPGGRARILSDVVESAVHRWEALQRQARGLLLGSLTAPEAAAALLEVFNLLGHLLLAMTPLPVAMAWSEVTGLLLERWESLPGKAEVAARDAVHFWDEETGIFVAGGDPPTLAARLQLLAELGEARFIAAQSAPDQGNWVRSVINDSLKAESLGLAAGLSTTVADELVRGAARAPSHEPDLLAARVFTEGAKPSPEMFLEHIVSLRHRLCAAPDPQVRWEVAQAITNLEVPADRQPEIIEEFDRCLPVSHHLVGHALAYGRWDVKTQPADQALRQVLQSDPPPRLEPAPAVGYVIASVDRGFADAIELAARRLLPAHPELADDVARAAWQTTMGTVRMLKQLLIEHGHAGALQEAMPSRLRGIRGVAAGIGLADMPDRLLFSYISELARPTELTIAQARRLSTLGDFTLTLRLPDSAIGDLASTLANHRDDLHFIISTIVTLGGFDPGVLAAEAKVALAQFGDGEDQVDLSFVFDDATLRPLVHWEAVEDPDALQARLVTLLAGHPWLAKVAQHALENAPKLNSKKIITQIEALLPALSAAQRSMAAEVEILVDPDQLGRCRTLSMAEDPVLRSVAARCLGTIFHHQKGATADDLTRLLRDKEAGVQEALLKQLQEGDIEEPIAAQVEVLAAARPSAWHCLRCDTGNDPGENACTHCRRPAPDPISLAKKLLDWPIP